MTYELSPIDGCYRCEEYPGHKGLPFCRKCMRYYQKLYERDFIKQAIRDRANRKRTNSGGAKCTKS